MIGVKSKCGHSPPSFGCEHCIAWLGFQEDLARKAREEEKKKASKAKRESKKSWGK